MAKHRWRFLLAALFLTSAGLMATACGGDDPDDPGLGGVIITTAVPTDTPAAVELTPAPTAVSSTDPSSTATPSGATNGSAQLRGFSFPIAGACLPTGDQLMPNAARPYRNGIHEGVDFYDVDNCATITMGTPVLAARAGTVVRADLDFVDPTAAEIQAYLANPNTEQSLDKFRGRQVWIQHDDGGVYVSRYAHLSGIAPGIARGVRVTVGQVIAYVGESGTPESVSNPGHEYHLHWEMRVGASYLGAGLPADQVRALYLTLFSP